MYLSYSYEGLYTINQMDLSGQWISCQCMHSVNAAGQRAAPTVIKKGLEARERDLIYLQRVQM